MSDKPEAFVLEMTQPKSMDECVDHMKHMVNHFYDASDGVVPVAMIIDWLLDGQGPMRRLVGRIAKDTGLDYVRVACAMCTAIGMYAREREVRWVREQCQDMEEATIDFIKANNKRLSFLMICAMSEKVGLGCSCGFCVAVHFANNYEKGKGPELLNQLAKFNAENREEDKCCAQLVKEAAARFGWGGHMTGQWTEGGPEDEPQDEGESHVE